MRRAGIPAASFVFLIGLVSPVSAEPPVLVSCDDPPAAVLALGEKSEIEAYGIAAEEGVTVAAITSADAGTGSVLRFAKAGEAPKDVKLAGRVLGLAVAPDGSAAYAIVRVTNRKGVIRSVELVRVDLATAKVSPGPTVPSTARGLAVAPGGATLLIASRDDVRSLKLPGLASGPLYRVLGDNVGVAPIAGSSFVILAQPSRVVLADLAGPQDRNGLVLSQEVAAPAPLRGMMATTGDTGPVAVSEGGLGWCVRVSDPPPPPPAAPPAEAPAPVVPVEEPPAEQAPAVVPPAAVAPPVESPQDPPAANHDPAERGTVSGFVTGAALTEVAAIVLLGPDNVLREAARVIPDAKGRFTASTLASGTYRIVAAGKGGRVLICDPSFITIRVDSNGAVEAPLLTVLSAR
jgi:hypothetical protein